MTDKVTVESLNNEIVEEYKNNESLIANEYYKKMLSQPLRKKTILMEVRDGNSFSGNVRSMYLGMLRDERFKEWKFYISYQDLKNVKKIQSNLPKHAQTYWIEHRSLNYLEALATCEYVMNASTFPSFFMKRKGQIYINTWHGTPLKHMGRDLPGIKDNQNVLRNFLMTDYLLSPNAHTTQLFKNRYQLDGLYEGEILEGGYPRIDETFRTESSFIVKRAHQLGIKMDKNKKTLLYTPTWRGSQVHQPVHSFEVLEAEIEALQMQLPEWNILVKVHPFIAELASQRTQLKSVLVPDTEDVNEWLAAVDLLATDYSSIFFDYLVTERPIVFYCPDTLNYEQNRGLYFKASDLPGPVVTRFDDLIQAIRNAKYSDKMKDMIAYEDGKVTERYIEAIFFHKKTVKSVKCQTKKKKLLLYAGGMKNNGITTALLNLCHTLDASEYDITVFLGGAIHKESESNIRCLPSSVRLMFHLGYPIYDREERLYDKLMTKLPTKEHYDAYFDTLKSAYQREACRLFPNIHFDVAIDFSGYAYFWAKYILFAPASRHLVYLHNDIMEEWESKEHHRAPLTGLMLLYPHFDALVNVTSSLQEVNAKKLKEVVSSKKHVYAPNFIDLDWQTNHQSVMHTKVSFEGYLIEEVLPLGVTTSTRLAMQRTPWDESDIELEVSPNDCIISQSTYVLEGKRYFRLQVNGIERGWCKEQKQFNKIGLYILERQSIDKEGVILPHNGQAYVKATKTHVPLISAGTLKRLHHATVRVKSQLVTKQGIFYEVESGAWTGTLKAQDVSLDRVGSFKLGKEIPTLSQSTTRFIMVKNTEAPLYSGLKGLPGTKEIGSAQSLEQQYLYNFWEMRNGYGTFYQYRTKNNQIGWIDSSDVEIIQTPLVPIAQKETYPHEVTGDLVLAYKDEAAMERNEKTWISHLSGHLQVHQKLWTQRGIFYEVSGEYEGLIEESAVGGRVIEGRLRDIEGQFIYPLRPDCRHYMTMGRLSPEKNHFALIEGFAQWLKENPQLKEEVDLLILGDGILKDELKALIQKLDLKDNIFLLGHIKDSVDILRHAHGFIFPSLYEGQGLALIEAMTLKIPVAATDIPVLRQVMGDGRYGYLIDGTNANAIKHAFECLDNQKIAYEYFNPVSYQEAAKLQLQRILFPKLIDKVKVFFSRS